MIDVESTCDNACSRAAEGVRLLVTSGLLKNPVELIALDWHDWNRDAFSRGAWVASRLGAEGDLLHQNWKRQGRLAFASSDISPEGAGWFDAAAISGAAAAQEIMELLRLN